MLWTCNVPYHWAWWIYPAVDGSGERARLQRLSHHAQPDQSQSRDTGNCAPVGLARIFLI
jgi:hypothetical protein